MWKAKVLIQFVLARLPWHEQINYHLQRMRGSYGPEAFKSRTIALIENLMMLQKQKHLDGCDVLEIGTGWDAIGPLGLYLLGARTVVTLDHVPHLRWSLARAVLDQMEQSLDPIASITAIPRPVLEQRLERVKPAASLPALLERAGITYQAPADAGHTGLRDHSMDLVYSHQVLMHIPEEGLHALAEESRRVLKPGGIAFHHINLGDPYAIAAPGVSCVNFLRYSRRWWAFFTQNKISYNNRLREKQFLDILRSHEAGVRVVHHVIRPEDLKALKAMPVDAQFTGLTPEELAVYCSDVAVSFDAAAGDLPSHESR